jgi:hypothetical protein
MRPRFWEIWTDRTHRSVPIRYQTGTAAFVQSSYSDSPAASRAYTLSGMKLRRILFMRTLLPLRGLPQSGSQQG